MFGFFKGLFSNKSKSEDKVRSSTLVTGPDDGLVILDDQTKTAYRVASCQSSGRERNHNEDTLFTLNSLLDGIETTVSFGLFLVADGMGGHHSGEKASSLAAHAASQYLLEKVYYDFTYDHKEFSDVDIEQYLRNAVEAAQLLISRQVPGGGTTLTLVLALGDRMFFTHVGDSRCYKIDLEGKMSLKTKDHSLVKRLIDLGEITEDDAKRHPQRNVLYRALGQNDPFKPDVGQFDLLKGERLLICSDGLWGVLEEEQMLEIINHKKVTIEQIACDLVQAANDSGGPDNISLILVERLV